MFLSGILIVSLFSTGLALALFDKCYIHRVAFKFLQRKSLKKKEPVTKVQNQKFININ